MSFLLTACKAPQQEIDQGIKIDTKFDETLYLLTLKLEEDPASYSQIHGSVSGTYSGFNHIGYGNVSGSIWQDGKGLVRGILVDLEPSIDLIPLGQVEIIKTTDFKVMALKPGDTVKLVCTRDYEPVCSLKPDNSQFTTTSQCRDLWEFDYCRLVKVIPVD
ncbi:MAG: hypothetical protein ACOX6Q_00145 [Candidatus Dojkabacteria bacterium]